MNHYLVSFPSSAMDHVTAAQMPSVSDASHAVIREAKAAGVYVFGGGLDESVAPVLVAADGTVTAGTYPENTRLNGGFCVIRASTRQEAETWAARIAAACRCAQELRVFMFDPES